MTDIEQEARAEAEKRWARPGGASHPAIRTPREWLDEGMASGFVLGAQWAASRPASPARETVAEGLVDRIAVAIAKAADGDYWTDEIAEWEGAEDWEREAHPDNYPETAYEDREFYRKQARAALEAALTEGNAD